MRARRATPILVATLVAGLPAPAAAQQPPLVLGVPVPVGLGEGASLATGLDGTITAAWASVEETGTDPDTGRAGYRSTILIADRLPGLAAFTPPQVVAVVPTIVREPSLARSAAGHRALGWLGPERRGDPTQPPMVALAEPGQRFGAPEELPLPEKLPVAPGNETVIQDSRSTGAPAVAVAADGAMAAIACEADARSGTQMALIWLRPAGGSWSAGERVGRCIGTVRVAADARGGILALWTGGRDDGSEPAKRIVWVVERIPGGTSFGERRALSDPNFDADNNAAKPQLHLNARGDALAMWNGGGLFGGLVGTAVRPVGGQWGPPTGVAPGDRLTFRPGAAVNERGDMAVAWDEGSATGGAFRGAGGAFGPPTSNPHPPGAVVETKVALDAFGTAVTLRGGDPDDRLLLALRRPDGVWAPEQPATLPGVLAGDGQVATDPYGNGVVVWTARRGPARAIFATPYSAASPQLSAVRLSRTELRLRSSEPARVGLTATSASSRRARQTVGALLPGQTTKVVLSNAVRRVLRTRSGRLTVRARDAGPAVTTRRLKAVR